MTYPIHTIETAAEDAKESLEGAMKKFGFVPNLLAVMAAAPSLLTTYLTADMLFDETSFDPTERQVVMLTTSYENGCEYCMGAHSAMSTMQKIPDDVVQALRAGRPITDPKLEALRRLTSAIVTSRGFPSSEVVAAFHAAGYTQTQALEVVLGVGFKILANYTNHIAATPLDKAFAKVAWTKAA